MMAWPGLSRDALCGKLEIQDGAEERDVSMTTNGLTGCNGEIT
jgi:hypothetical protein